MSGVPLWLWSDWEWAVVAIISLFVLLFFPLALTQTALLVRWIIHPSKKMTLPPVLRRRIRVVICTNGKATNVVEYLLKTIYGYGLPRMQCYVIKEEADEFVYSAKNIVVPKDYETKNHSWTKERALQYAVEWGRDHGWGKDDYVVHLDDDSLVTKGYLEYVMGMSAEVGQGSLKLRAFGVHVLSTFADMVRVSDCETWCRFWNERKSPKAVHGEGLVIRADAEQRIGWDYATFCGEDFIMGQRLVAAGYHFVHIPYDVLIAPPTNMRDFLKQRRRWTWGIFSAWPLLKEENRATVAWVLYRYSVGWTGFMGFFLFVYAVLLHIPIPEWLAVISSFNLLAYFAYYQAAAWETKPAYMLPMLVLQYPVAFYEGVAFPYSFLWPPDRHQFETVHKV